MLYMCCMHMRFPMTTTGGGVCRAWNLSIRAIANSGFDRPMWGPAATCTCFDRRCCSRAALFPVTDEYFAVHSVCLFLFTVNRCFQASALLLAIRMPPVSRDSPDSFRRSRSGDAYASSSRLRAKIHPDLAGCPIHICVGLRCCSVLVCVRCCCFG